MGRGRRAGCVWVDSVLGFPSSLVSPLGLCRPRGQQQHSGCGRFLHLRFTLTHSYFCLLEVSSFSDFLHWCKVAVYFRIRQERIVCSHWTVHPRRMAFTEFWKMGAWKLHLCLQVRFFFVFSRLHLEVTKSSTTKGVARSEQTSTPTLCLYIFIVLVHGPKGSFYFLHILRRTLFAVKESAEGNHLSNVWPVHYPEILLSLMLAEKIQILLFVDAGKCPVLKFGAPLPSHWSLRWWFTRQMTGAFLEPERCCPICFFFFNSPFLPVCLSHFTIKVYASVNSPRHVGFWRGFIFRRPPPSSNEVAVFCGMLPCRYWQALCSANILREHLGAWKTCTCIPIRGNWIGAHFWNYLFSGKTVNLWQLIILLCKGITRGPFSCSIAQLNPTLVYRY